MDYLVGEKGVEEYQASNKEEKPLHTQNTQDESSRNLKSILFFSLAIIAYLFLAIASISAKYVDFGDGNYLYLSWRLALGDVLYRDLPSPQPPLLLFLGSFLLSLTEGDPILVRLWQAIQHALTACCVYGIAFRIFSRSGIAMLAGSIYLFLPEGVWWAAGYQSEPLLVLLQSFNLLLFIDACRKEKPTIALYGAAIVSVMCCYTNMTALPYVLLQWFFVWLHFNRFFWRYSLTVIIPGILFFIWMYIYSEGQYVEHVFFRQVGTYPANSLSETINYFIRKLVQEGGDILYYEGGFVFAAMAGMFLFSGRDEKEPLDSYILWWAIFSLGSIIFVTKGGTVEYIFTLAEPAVAVFSAFFFMTLFAAADLRNKVAEIVQKPIELGKYVLIFCLFLPALFLKPTTLLYATFTNSPSVFEIEGKTMLALTSYLKRNIEPENEIISPPYYAFMAQRKISQNASSLFILGHTYFNEWKRFQDRIQEPLDLPTLEEAFQAPVDFNNVRYSTQSVFDLDDLFASNSVLRQEYPAIAMFLDMRRQIIEGEVDFIIVNRFHLFYFVPPLHQAIRDYCELVELPFEVNTREEQLLFYRVSL